MAEQLKVGDKVILNSGGPQMTVMFNQGDRLVMCKWFNQASPNIWGEVSEQEFPPAALEKK